MVPMKKLIVVLLILVVSAVILYVLKISVDNPRLTHGGFNRVNDIPVLVRKYILNSPVYGVNALCGYTDENLYFATQDIRMLLQTDRKLRHPQRIQLDFDSSMFNQLAHTETFFTAVTYPSITIFLQNEGAVFTGHVNMPIHDLHKLDRNFNNAVKLSDQSVLLKGFDSTHTNLVFKKVNFRKDEYQWEQDITDRIHDGGFASDGVLSFDESLQCLVYTHYYFNGIAVFDTALNVLKRGHTIDTFMHPQAKGYPIGKTEKEIQAMRGFTLRRPPVQTNAYSTAAKGKLYVASLLLANNEDIKLHITHSVIDVYDIATCRYLTSFYIPFYRNQSLQNFTVVENDFVGVYPGYVIVYKMSG